MTFNKQKYQKRRAKKLRGQGDPIKSKLTPKGEKIPYITRENNKAEYPNAPGSYSVPSPKGFTTVNRPQARKRVINRDYTRPNYAYRTSRSVAPFGGHVRVREPYESPHAPNITNHQRMLERAEARQ